MKNSYRSVKWFGGRESIFLISHTNSFAEFGKVAHEAGVACGPL